MSILWCGGEDIDFPNGSSVLVTSSAGEYRPIYARCSVGGTSPIRSITFPAVTSCWLSCRFFMGVNVATSVKMVGLMNSGSSGGLFVGASTTSIGKLALYAYSGSSLTQLAAESGASITGTLLLKKLDIQVSAFGATATVNVYWESVLIISFSGSLLGTGMVNINQVAHAGNSGATNTSFSEVIVADEDTRGMSMVTLAPAAAGTTDDWTGAYTDIDEVTINDADVVSTNTAGLDEQFGLTDLPSGTFVIQAVKSTARAKTTAGAIAVSVGLGVFSNGGVSAGTLQALTTSFASKERLMLQNPLTNLAWTQSEINALQMNLRSGA